MSVGSRYLMITNRVQCIQLSDGALLAYLSKFIFPSIRLCCLLPRCQMTLYSLPIYLANLFYPLPGILNKGIDAIKSSFSRGHLLLIGWEPSADADQVHKTGSDAYLVCIQRKGKCTKPYCGLSTALCLLMLRTQKYCWLRSVPVLLMLISYFHHLKMGSHILWTSS